MVRLFNKHLEPNFSKDTRIANILDILAQTGGILLSYLGIRTEKFNPNVLFAYKSKFNFDNKKVPLHFHEFLNINYVTTGTCQYVINDTLYNVKKGNVIIINPNIKHAKKVKPKEEVTEFHIGITELKLDHLQKNNLISNRKNPIIALKKYNQDFYNCYHELITIQEQRDIGWELMNKVLVTKLLVILLKELAPVPTEKIQKLNFESYDNNTIVKTITAYMEDNYKKKISLDKITENTFLSTTYINKIFKEITGETPINYLINIRINKAKEILEEGHFSIQEVAEKVGYSDAYYFSKLFKKRYGTSPSEYKAVKSN